MLFRQLSLTAKQTVRYTEQNEGCMIFMKSPVPIFMFFHCFIISQIIVILIQRVICLFSHAAKTFPDSPRSLLLIKTSNHKNLHRCKILYTLGSKWTGQGMLDQKWVVLTGQIRHIVEPLLFSCVQNCNQLGPWILHIRHIFCNFCMNWGKWTLRDV